MLRRPSFPAKGAPGATQRPDPLHHHPVIAISAILLVAAVVQIGVWLLNARLSVQAPLKLSSITAHGLFYDHLTELASRLQLAPGLDQQVVFVLCLLTVLASAVAWYLAASLAFGKTWGLWVGLLWVAHPLYAFSAQRPGPLALLIAVVAFSWLAVIRCSISRRKRDAMLAGFALGLIPLVSVPGLVLLPLMVFAMLMIPGQLIQRLMRALLMCVGFGLPLVVGVAVLSASEGRQEFKPTLAEDLWGGIDVADGSEIALAARARLTSQPTDHRPSPTAFLWEQARQSPGEMSIWLARRMWSTLYTTSDPRFQRPLFAVQVFWLAWAIWGFLVSIGSGRRRFAAGTAAVFLALSWATAAVAEPLASALAPAGCVLIILGLIGIVDFWGRLLGRRPETCEA